MDENEGIRWYVSYGIGSGDGHLSPEGRMLARLDEAAARVSTEADITDELRCHLRRIDKEARA